VFRWGEENESGKFKKGHGPVQAEVKIPVIDPSLAALTMAQSIVQMKLTQSKGAYPFPQDKKRFI
jgi:hypothetical protein